MKIAICKSRTQKQYQNTDVSWEELKKKLSQTIRTTETVAEYKAMTKDKQADIKDVGGFVAGELKNGLRNSRSVLSRSAITLDADFASREFIDKIELLYEYRCLIYSTHKHTPEKPKYRWIIPLDRDVTPEEYEAIARRTAEFIGMNQFDDTTYQPSRMMFFPSTSRDGKWVYKELEGPTLPADEVLATYRDWKDLSTWPRSDRETELHHKQVKKQKDPLTKAGWIGAFCRTYTIQDAIEKFIPEEYTPTADPNRWTYAKGSTAGGLVIYDDKFAYSNHSTDPSSMQLCNAYDLVRIHKWPDDPDSTKKMNDFIAQDAETKATLAQEKAQEAESAWQDLSDDSTAETQQEGSERGKNEAEPSSDWLDQLEMDKKGSIQATTDNIVIILRNDPRLKDSIGGNDIFQQKPVKFGSLPWWKWDPSNPGWTDADDAGLRYYLEKCYKIVSKGKVDDAVAFIQEQNSFHPVRDYLNGLLWDGTPRVDTLFIDYLGAEDTAYSRAVARKVLAAAVARVMTPGCKFDNMPVLIGKQGIGKSHLLSILGGEWFSDSITTINGKEGYEALHGSWIIEWAELSAARKTDIESMKQFISKREDRYRKAYARRVTDNPRQCVFIGTTNDDEFLRDYTGNRRFWPLQTDAAKATKGIFTDLPKERDQIWAEAVAIWKKHEPLYMDGSLSQTALAIQEEHTYRSVREDLVREYLDRKLPENWKNMSIFERTQWLDNPDNVGAVTRDRVCLLEIWCEVFNGNRNNFTNADQREFKAIMDHIGWHKGNAPRSAGHAYGKQRVYLRPAVLETVGSKNGNGGNGDMETLETLETVKKALLFP